MQVWKIQVRVNRASIIALIQYYTASWVGQGLAVKVSVSYNTVQHLFSYRLSSNFSYSTVRVNMASIIALIQYYTTSWIGQGSAVRFSASYSTVQHLFSYRLVRRLGFGSNFSYSTVSHVNAHPQSHRCIVLLNPNPPNPVRWSYLKVIS